MGLVKGIVDAIHGEDNRIAGRAFTKLIAPLTATATTAYVQSTMGFGVVEDGTVRGLLLVDGEIIESVARTQTPGDFRFLSLTRGAYSTPATAHAVGTLVYDVSENSSARDLLSRGFFVETAQGADLDTIGRNLGLHKCPGLNQETWRRVIQATAYLPKQPLAAFERVLRAYFNDTASWEVYERPSLPHSVFIDVDVSLGTSTRGKFYLNGGLRALTTGLTTVDTPHDIGDVLRVVLETPATKRGHRYGETDYFDSFVGNTITLGSSPGAIGTPVLIDWRPLNNQYHYLAPDIAARDSGDSYAYFSDNVATLRCLLNQVRAAGTAVSVRVRS